MTIEPPGGIPVPIAQPAAESVPVGTSPRTGDVSSAVIVTPTQMRRPWRSTVRTAFQALVGACTMAPVVYQAATNHDPTLATGAAATGLAITSGVARVMALPVVEDFLRRFVPFLAAAPRR